MNIPNGIFFKNVKGPADAQEIDPLGPPITKTNLLTPFLIKNFPTIFRSNTVENNNLLTAIEHQ
jgi:hypothetical protein